MSWICTPAPVMSPPARPISANVWSATDSTVTPKSISGPDSLPIRRPTPLTASVGVNAEVGAVDRDGSDEDAARPTRVVVDPRVVVLQPQRDVAAEQFEPLVEAELEPDHAPLLDQREGEALERHGQVGAGEVVEQSEYPVEKRVGVEDAVDEAGAVE